MAFKVTFSGIDGSGKSTAVETIARRAAALGLRTVHPYRPAFADLPGQPRVYFAVEVNHCMDHLHAWADQRGSRSLVGSVNLAYGPIGTLIEARAIRRFSPDLILIGRDPFLDPCAYCQYYFPFTQRLSSRTRMRIANQVIRPTRPDLVIYLDIDPNIAWTRIQDRIAKERIEGSGERGKWAHMHENPGDLAFLRLKLEEEISKLDTEVVRIDASYPREQVLDEILDLILERRSRRTALHDYSAPT